MGYEVYEDQRDVFIYEDEVEFRIRKGKGELLYIINRSADPVDVVIPHVFPTGHQINSILGSGTVTMEKYTYVSYFDSSKRGAAAIGKFGKITISDGIDVGYAAFYLAQVDEVVWPCSCNTIPEECFKGSSIKRISNIDNITTVEPFAFSQSNIERIKWPEKCKIIPCYCFSSSQLSTIENIDNVETIQGAAFLRAKKIKNFIWPSKCKYIPRECFAESELSTIYNIDNVEEIGSYAFYGSHLSKLDLTCSGVSSLAPEALEGIPPSCEVIPPYYMCEEELLKMFSKLKTKEVKR